jgi:predicted transcriptional regulator
MGNKDKEMEKPDLYVVARFLERLWKEGREFKKTELQMAVGLNYTIYIKYLKWLEKKELIKLVKLDSKHEKISITPKGIEAYRSLVEWIRVTIGEDKF